MCIHVERLVGDLETEKASRQRESRSADEHIEALQTELANQQKLLRESRELSVKVSPSC